MRHNSLNALLACCLTLLLAGQSLAAGVSVAFVHTARLLNESPQINTLKRKVGEDFAARERRLTEMQMQIKVLQEELEKEGPGMSASEHRRLKHDITTRRLKYKHARDELTQDKQLRYSEEEERVTRIIREVIEQVAQDEKIDIVLQSGVLWVSPEVDITDKVLKRLRGLAENGN
jgi:outer membrane protein